MRSATTWRHKIIELSPWFVAALVALSSHWAAHAIEHSIDAICGHANIGLSGIRLFYIIFFLIMVVILIKVRTAFFRPRTRYMRGETPEKREHLIIYLSDLIMNDQSKEGIPSGITIEGDFKKDLVKLVEYKKTHHPWRWEMPLRAIKHHLGKLKSITLICSDKSILQVGLFQNILKKYHQLNDVQIQLLIKHHNKPLLVSKYDDRQHKSWNFEEFDDLSNALIYLIKTFKSNGISEKEVMIDFTGGQKVTSVVAAAITFNRPVKAQYVQTNDPWNVRSYDILLGSSETGHIEL